MISVLFCNLVELPRRTRNKKLSDRDLTVLGFLCCTCIVPAQSELADDGVFTFILFLVFSGHVLIE